MRILKKHLLFAAAIIFLPGGFIIGVIYGADWLLRRRERQVIVPTRLAGL